MTKPAPVAREKAQESSVLDEAPPAEVEQPEVQASDRESELAALVKAMQARLDQLEGRQNETYADDDKLFIAKAGGENWSERRLDVATKSYVDIEMRATAFFGPFNTPEAVAAYLNAKKGKRPNDFMEWEDVRTVTGREKRKIEATERTDRENSGVVPRIPQYFQGR